MSLPQFQPKEKVKMKEYEALELEFQTVGNKQNMAEWIERLQKFIAITQTPKLRLEVSLRELKPSKNWQPINHKDTTKEGAP